MLIAAAARARHLGLNDLYVTGVEVDPELPVGVGSGVPTSVVRGDIFAVLADLDGQYAHNFDAVVGNPPYVRFESLGALYRQANPQLLDSTAVRFPGRADGELAALGIKSLLLASCFPSTWSSAARLQAAQAELSTGGRLPRLSGHERLWAEAVVDYPIRADLSIPVWLAAWRLVRAGGRVAFVTTDSWESRSYGKALRKFIGAAMQPALIVRQRRSWFTDAQVRASLVVCKAQARHSSEQCVIVEVPQDANLADPEVLHRHSRSRASGADPDALALASSKLLDVIASKGITGWMVRRSVAIEPPQERGRTAVHVGSVLPQALRSLVPDRSERLASLEELGVTVQQGLRTGCNPFFYVRIEREAGDSVEVRTDVEMGATTGEFDRRYLLPVLRYQHEVRGFATSSATLGSRALVIRNALTSSDFLLAQQRYPVSWLRRWVVADGLHALAGDLDQYVQEAAGRVLVRGGRERRIPQLSAVRPNERWPASKSDSPPPPPRGWYSLPLAPRHVPDILVPRVVDRLPRFVLNDADVLVDANFSSLTVTGPLPKPYFLAVLNSSWVRVWTELMCTPMGGGALKVEAEQLGRLPIPSHDAETVEVLSRLGSELVASGEVSRMWLRQVDEHVSGLSASGERLRREGEAIASKRARR
jgi:hypothetical protein